MVPRPPLLWEKNGKPDAIGVSNQELGAIHWKVENGIRLTGMPAFQGILTPLQIWQVSTLLANANKPLPPEALALLKGESVSPSPTEAGTQAAGLTAPAGMKFEVKRQPN